MTIKMKRRRRRRRQRNDNHNITGSSILFERLPSTVVVVVVVVILAVLVAIGTEPHRPVMVASATTTTRAAAAVATNLCTLFEGDYDGAVNFVPEAMTCGRGTSISIYVDYQSCDLNGHTAAAACCMPVMVLDHNNQATAATADLACCFEVLVNCQEEGTGRDHDLIPFMVTCPKMTMSSSLSSNKNQGAMALDCPSTVGTVDVWQIQDDRLTVQGRLENEASSNQKRFEFITGTRKKSQ